MAGFEHTSGFELIYAVVGYGLGSKFMHKARDYGLQGGTILPAKGTVQNAILNFFSLYDERKEMVLMGVKNPRKKLLGFPYFSCSVISLENRSPKR